MVKNLANIHKKLDRLIERMGAIEETRNLVRQVTQTNRYLAQSVNVMTQIVDEARKTTQQTAQMVERVVEIQSDIAVMAQEALKASRESAERTAEILAEMRKH
jgi:methyl-accepting chemotaxis protein